MRWNWQNSSWPNFSYNSPEIKDLEQDFINKSHFLSGAYHFLSHEQKEELQLDYISEEALNTCEIEGEYLNRDSVRSSIARHLGFKTTPRRASPAEESIVEMTLAVHQSLEKNLTHQMLFEWHLLLTQARRDLNRVGGYRTHEEPMQIVSGHSYKTKVHFEAPPSNIVFEEMDVFIKWFNASAPQGESPLPALTRASITHLYFVSIHPFEDGNGRIGRALVEKSLAQCIGHQTLIALSTTIQKNKKAYYNALERANKSNEITDWILYFAKTILASQEYTLKLIRFLVEKTKLYERVKDRLNPRQEKVLERIFREGLEGFKGGLSAENYISITNTSRATATRDLQDMVEKSILVKTGERKGARYRLAINYE